MHRRTSLRCHWRSAPVENGKGELRLTHEGIFSSDEMVFAVIRNSVVDPITGAISVKLLGRRSGCRVFQAIRCIDLTLDKPQCHQLPPTGTGLAYKVMCQLMMALDPARSTMIFPMMGMQGACS